MHCISYTRTNNNPISPGSFYFDAGYPNMASLGGMYESSYMYSSQFMNTMNPPAFEKVRFLSPGYLLVIYAST